MLLFFVLSSPALRAAPLQVLAAAPPDATFPLLQTKTGVYTNVTVTQKSQDSIFIMHSQGVCNVKVSDLPPEIQTALGYHLAVTNEAGEVVPLAAVASASASADAAPPSPPRVKFHLKVPNVKAIVADWRQNGRQRIQDQITQFKTDPKERGTVYFVGGGIYLFFSMCLWLICRKTHSSPGPLIWLPILQLIPLLRAANMAWFFACIIPVLNIVALIVGIRAAHMPWIWTFSYVILALNVIALIAWSIKIVKARGKSPWVSLFMLFPVTTVFAFLYLAFSSSAPVSMRSNDVLVLDFA
jgi:hypothetical protein